jgi:hypothetical protein
MTATCSRNSSIPIYAYPQVFREQNWRKTSITFLLVKVLDYAFGLTDSASSTACETKPLRLRPSIKHTVGVAELSLHIQLTIFLSISAFPGQAQNESDDVQDGY